MAPLTTMRTFAIIVGVLPAGPVVAALFGGAAAVVAIARLSGRQKQ
jgi:hypothetical protein